MALDADTRAILRQLAELGVRPMHELTPDAARAQLASTRPQPVALRCMHGVDEIALADGGSHSLRIKVLVPCPAPVGFMVYFHGGGWVVGGIEDFEPLCRELAHGTGCAVAIVDYRLAPEHPFPAAVEDAWRAVTWAAASGVAYTGVPVPLIVAGDSAGGNLAALVAQRSRDEGGPRVALQALAYPVTDGAMDTSSYHDPDNQLLLTRDTMQWFWQHYVPDERVRLNATASPLRAPDLSGLPPVVLVTAEHDVLRDEAEAYAERLQAAGVPVRWWRAEGHMHGFLSRFAAQPSARTALAAFIENINAGLRSSRVTAVSKG